MAAILAPVSDLDPDQIGSPRTIWTDASALDRETTITALPSNHHALALGFEFACGQRTFVGIGGPSGWGKSELLEHVSRALGQIWDEPVGVVQAAVWAASQEGAGQSAVLLLDDLQDVLRYPRLRQRLRTRLEHRRKRNLPTMFCLAGDFSLSVKSRLISPGQDWHLAQILAPSPVERQCVAHELASAERLLLNPSIEALIATHLNGNGRSMRGALLRLKLIKQDWRSEEDFAEACGVLMPYMIGADGWDPRDVASDAVNHLYLAWPETPPFGKRAAQAYALNRLIGLPEGDVASFLRISAGQVYRHSKNVQERTSCHHSAEFVEIVRTHVFAALAHSAKWIE